MKALPFIIAATVLGMVWYLWRQLTLWRCAFTGSTEVYAGSVVSPSLQCAAQLGLYGLTYDSSTGGVGKGTMPSTTQAEIDAYQAASQAKTGNGDAGQSALDMVVEWATETFTPWEDVGMSKDDWCNSELPTQAQRFSHCDVLTWF